MTTTVEWQDIAPDSSLAEFAAQNNLEIQSLSHFQGALILPTNTALGKMVEQHLFSPGAKELLFVLRESGVSADLYQDSRERRELVLKSATVVLPMVYFVGGAASTVVLGLLSNWIYDKFVKKKQSEEPTIIKCEYAALKPDGSVRWRRVEGPADQVSALLLQESKCDQSTNRKKGSRKPKR